MNEYTVIGPDGLVYGPFDLFSQAQSCAEQLSEYQILNSEGKLFDWRTAPKPGHAASASI